MNGLFVVMVYVFDALPSLRCSSFQTIKPVPKIIQINSNICVLIGYLGMLQFQFIHDFANSHVLYAFRKVFGFMLFYSGEEFLNSWLVYLTDNLIGI